MSDREMVLHLVRRLNREIVEDRINYIEINSTNGEDISFEFDENGNIIDMYWG